MPRTDQTGYYEIMRAIQRAGRGGCAKAVNITIFFNEHGEIIGRSEAQEVKLFPGGDVSKLVGLLFGGD